MLEKIIFLKLNFTGKTNGATQKYQNGLSYTAEFALLTQKVNVEEYQTSFP